MKARGVGLGPARGDAHPRDRARDAVTDERVQRLVRVPRNEIGRAGAEADTPAVAAQHRAKRLPVRLRPPRRHVHPLRDPPRPVSHERVGQAVRVAGHEVRCERPERHEATVGTDRRALAPSVRLSVRPYRHAHGLPTLPVSDEHVGDAVAIARVEVRRARREGDDVAVGADARGGTAGVRLRARRSDADALGPTRGEVVHEDVLDAVVVAADEVCRERAERDDSAVSAEGGVGAGLVRLGAGGGHAHAHRPPRPQVADKDVTGAIGVTADEIARNRGERDDATVRADRAPPAPSVRLRAVRADVDALRHARDAGTARLRRPSFGRSRPGRRALTTGAPGGEERARRRSQCQGRAEHPARTARRRRSRGRESPPGPLSQPRAG